MATLAKKLQNKYATKTITLCVSDFKAQLKAKELGVSDIITLDVLRNMANVINKNDILIYESNEDGGLIQQDLQEYCSIVKKIDESSYPIVDDELCNGLDEGICDDNKIVFFSDDDYSNEFLNTIKSYDNKIDANLILGDYFFLNNDEVFKKYFNNVYENEEYYYILKESRFVLTTSAQSAFEARANGSVVMFFNRADKPTISKNLQELLKNYGVIVYDSSEQDFDFANLLDDFFKLAKSYASDGALKKELSLCSLKLAQQSKINIDNILKDI